MTLRIIKVVVQFGLNIKSDNYMIRKYVLFLFLFVTQLMHAGVTVKISDGIEDGSVKQKMETVMSAFLTEVNTAQPANRSINFRNLGIAVPVQESISMLWENSPFQCTDEEIVEICIITGSGYQVRNIPLMMCPTDKSFNEEEYQEAVFSFDRQGNLESFYLTLSLNLYMNVIKSNKEVTDLRRRQLILDYVEHFRTSYNQKDLAFLNQVFSDDALIITGKVIKQSKDGIRLPDKIEYKKQSKQEYLNNLKRNFANNKYIKVTFDEIEVMRHPVNADFYGVTLHQGYTSSNYHDDGYLFLLWDFRDEKAPQIHVRTWQPDAYNVDGKGTQRIPKDEIFSLSDFDI